MTGWELITEFQDSGYYIGWRRRHKLIHIPEPQEPMGKASLIQISGNKENGYEVQGSTCAHSVFKPHEVGLELFYKTYHYATLPEARIKAHELKREIARTFDDVTRSDRMGNLELRKET